jgi:hypothetical protein
MLTGEMDEICSFLLADFSLYKKVILDKKCNETNYILIMA